MNNKHNENGYLIEPFDERKWEKKIVSFLKEGSCNRPNEIGFENFTYNFYLERMTVETSEFFVQLIYQASAS